MKILITLASGINDGFDMVLNYLLRSGVLLVSDFSLAFHEIDASQHIGPKFHKPQKLKYTCQKDEENMAY